MLSLQEKFIQRVLAPTDINEHLPTLYALTVSCRAKTVIELGAGAGNSTIAFLAALEYTRGHLWSVDCAPEVFPILVDAFGEVLHWTRCTGDDEDSKVPRWLPTEADVLFIDTTHEYKHTWHELVTYVPYVRSGGYIILHDTISGPGVSRAITEWLRCDCNEGFSYYNFEHCNGLGVMIKE